MPREQMVLFSRTLDEAIPADHPVRLLDEILRSFDWSAWVLPAGDVRGRPPLHPRVLAAALLYGLMRRVRSSRQLEYLCGHSFDFLWLTEGHRPDHSTLCLFRRRSHDALKDLFRRVGRLAMGMGLVRLGEVALDGTRVKASASRHHTWTAAKVATALQDLDQLFDERMAEANAADDAEAGTASATQLPAELASLEQRRQKLQELQETLQAMDAARAKEGKIPEKNPAQLPKADLEARVMPNKEGGHAPNYTPLVAVDVASGIIVDCEVTAAANEHPETLPTVDRIEENFGQQPAALLADTAHGTGENLAGLESRGVTAYTPQAWPSLQPGHPAWREDPTQPVAEALWASLPRNRQKQLDKSCFFYEPPSDQYRCPLGRRLRYVGREQAWRNGQKVEVRIYRCDACDGCPLGRVCRAPKSLQGRSLRRDAYEPQRERQATRMQTAEAQAIYARRWPSGERPFASLKGVLGLRQFLLRGLAKVRQEWCWACVALNLTKLLGAVAALRAPSPALPVEANV